MNSIAKISRRGLLATMALLPARPWPFRPISTLAQPATPRAAAIVERWASQAGDPRLRAGDHRPASPIFVPPGGAHRHLRPGRHAVGRASDVHAGRLLPRSGPGRGREKAGAQERRALQDRALRQSRGDGEALDAGSREDSRRDPHRHVGRRIQAEAKKWIEAAQHPRWKRPYTELTYQPMLEVLRYLRDNGYKTYIVTGGGQDFVRVYADGFMASRRSRWWAPPG